MLRVRKYGGAELSTGGGSNPAFTDSRPGIAGVQAEAGSVAHLELYTDEGETYPDLALVGVTGVEFSLDGSAYEASGNGITVGTVTSLGTDLYVRVFSAADVAPKLPLPQSGIAVVTGPEGGISITLGIAGTAIRIPLAAGALSATAAIVGSPLAVKHAAGVALASVGAVGTATAEELTPNVAGVVNATVGAVGAAKAVPLASGVVNATVGIAGDADAETPTLGQVGTVTPTVGDGQVALDWADVTNATGYTIEYMASASEPASWTGASSTTSATSAKTVTGLTNATKYYFRVKATASGYTDGAWSATANGTPEAASSSITGTYYVDRTIVTGGLRRLDTTQSNATSGSILIQTYENGGDYARASYRMVVVNSAGTVQRTVKDWTAIGDDLTTETSGQSRTTGATQSFSDPAVTTGEYFGIQFRIGDGIQTVDSEFFVLPAATNPGPQSGMTVAVTGLGRGFEEEDILAFLTLTYLTSSYAYIVFAGA